MSENVQFKFSLKKKLVLFIAQKKVYLDTSSVCSWTDYIFWDCWVCYKHQLDQVGQLYCLCLLYYYWFPFVFTTLVKVRVEIFFSKKIILEYSWFALHWFQVYSKNSVIHVHISILFQVLSPYITGYWVEFLML